jgi:hypothetical protein
LLISLICLAVVTSSGLWAQGTSSEPGKAAAKTKQGAGQYKSATQPARSGKEAVKGKVAEADKQPSKDKTATKDSKDRLAKDKPLPAFTLEREAAALTFVSRHHPDLAQLLGQLKSSQPDQYERAIRELFRTSENLAQLQEREPQRYEFELESWRLNSRIQVLAARLTMGTDAEIESQLRQALQAQADLRIQQQQQVRDRMAERLTQADRDLDSARRDREAKVERDYQKVLQSVGRGKPRK